MRVLVCGGRDWADYLRTMRVMDAIHDETPIALVIHGGAPGADDEADSWAYLRGIPVSRFDADWKRDGRAAGPLRNQRMIDQARPELVVAFPGGRGTADMVGRARRTGIKIIEVGLADDMAALEKAKGAGS